MLSVSGRSSPRAYISARSPGIALRLCLQSGLCFIIKTQVSFLRFVRLNFIEEMLGLSNRSNSRDLFNNVLGLISLRRPQ